MALLLLRSSTAALFCTRNRNVDFDYHACIYATKLNIDSPSLPQQPPPLRPAPMLPAPAWQRCQGGEGDPTTEGTLPTDVKTSPSAIVQEG